MNLLNENEREFVQYILRNYIDVGEDELDISKLSTVVRAKYGSIKCCTRKSRNCKEIKEIFIDFLYIEIAA